MNLEIALNEDFKIMGVTFTGRYKFYYYESIDAQKLGIVIYDKKRLAIRDYSNQDNLKYYDLADFDYVIFHEEDSQSKYKIPMFESNFIESICEYLKWRGVSYELKNSEF